jgi:hypothetical protein
METRQALNGRINFAVQLHRVFETPWQGFGDIFVYPGASLRSAPGCIEMAFQAIERKLPKLRYATFKASARRAFLGSQDNR